MDHAPLDKFLALNRHLEALAAAGIPLDLGVRGMSAAEALERFNAKISLRIGRGQSLATALADDQQHDRRLPAAYRAAMSAALDSNDSTIMLDALSQPAEARQELRQTEWRSLTPPLILLILAYGAFIYLCLYVSPTIEATYDQLGEHFEQQAGAAARFLAVARAWLPVWGPLLPPLLALGIWAWRRGDRLSRWRWIPGMRKYLAATRHASFATGLARLVEHNLPLVDALPLAAVPTGDRRLAAAAATIANARREGAPIDEGQNELQALPPLLQWALTESALPEEMDSARLSAHLRLVGEAYRRAAERQAARWRFAVPAIVGGLLGGAIVLAYGLTVFTPLVRLLENLSLP